MTETVEGQSQAELDNVALTVILDRWEKYIKHTARTISSILDHGNMDEDEITSTLREAVWRAYTTWDSTKGTLLSTWTMGCILNERKSILENISRRSPRNLLGHIVPLLYIDANIHLDDDDDDVAFQLEDVLATDKIELPLLKEIYNDCIKGVHRVVDPLSQKIIRYITSGEYTKDQQIADVLTAEHRKLPKGHLFYLDEAKGGKIDFSKISDVRLKLKMGFAIMFQIPPSDFTNNINTSRNYNWMLTQFKNHNLVKADTPSIPLAPKETSPGSKEENGMPQLEEYTLTWNAVGDAVGYEVSIYSWPFSETHLSQRVKVNKTYYTIPKELLNDKKYCWTVRGINSLGYRGSNSKPKYFKAI